MIRAFLFLTVFSSLNCVEMREFLSAHVPMTADGKIDIPEHIKHIKIDIGLSYHAPNSYNWLINESDLFVFGFEPNPSSINTILDENLRKPFQVHAVIAAKYVGKSFFLIPCALGSQSGENLNFYVTKEDAGCSSLYVPKFFDIEEVIPVPVFRLAEFFDLFPFDTHPIIEYIKIDAQGADLDIIKGAGDFLSQRVIYVTIEPENNQYEDTNNSAEAIDHFMQTVGFVKHESDRTQDPTYINNRFFSYAKENNIRIYQGPPCLDLD